MSLLIVDVKNPFQCEFCGEMGTRYGQKYGSFDACEKCCRRKNATLLEPIKCDFCGKESVHIRMKETAGECFYLCVDCHYGDQ